MDEIYSALIRVLHFEISRFMYNRHWRIVRFDFFPVHLRIKSNLSNVSPSLQCQEYYTLILHPTYLIPMKTPRTMAV